MEAKRIKPYQWVVIAISFFLLFFGKMLPSVIGLSVEGMQGLGIFIGTLLLMLFVDTSWPPVACIVACAFSGLMTVQEALTASIGGTVTQYVLFATMLAYALRNCGFLDRVAYWVVTRPIAKKHPWAYMGILLLAPLVVGWFTDLMTNLIVFHAIYAKVFETAGYKKGDKMPKLFMMSLILVDGMSCGSTPISHVGTVVAIGLYETSTGNAINFASYCAWGMLFSLIFLALLIVVLRFVFRMDVSGLADVEIDKIEVDPKIKGAITKEEILNVLVFGIAVVLWVAPGLLQFAVPSFYTFWNKLGTVTPAMIGCILLALIHCNGKPLMNFLDAFKNGVAWGAVLLTSSVMILIKVLGLEAVGLNAALATAMAPMTSGMRGMVFVLFAVFLVVLMTNFVSNTVSNALIYTLTVPLVLAGTVTGVAPITLTCLLSYGCEMAISTPAASAYAGMMNGFGWFDSGYQLRTGMILSMISVVVITVIGYPLGLLMLG